MKPRRSVMIGLIAGLIMVFAVTAITAGPSPRSEAQIKREVEQQLSSGRELRRALRDVDMSVQGSEVTLSGTVPHLWAKEQAIDRTLQVEGVETVASELIIENAESDVALAEEVGKAIQDYEYYTVFDFIDGSINNGVVMLTGYVTPTRDKKGDIGRRVARVQGVQELQNDIQILSPSSTDDVLRRTIAYQVFTHGFFERFASMTNPPFHIIVNNSVVTLVGVVQSEADKRVLEAIARHAMGVLRVESYLETRTGR